MNRCDPRVFVLRERRHPPSIHLPSTFTMMQLYMATSGVLQSPLSTPKVLSPVFNKPLSTPDPIPEEGVMKAMELMRQGSLFRYQPGVLSETAQAEAALCEYTGFKYSVGFNSCGSALFIALKCLGVQPGEAVLANAFSFTAVPSAIHHAGTPPGLHQGVDGIGGTVGEG